MLPDRYVPRKISEISKNDKKIAIIGKIVDVTDDSFILDDNSGKIEVFFGEEGLEGLTGLEGSAGLEVPESLEVRSESSEIVEKGKTIRAFCSVADDQLKLDVVQDLAGLDLNLLKTVDELYSKAGV